MSSFAIFRLPHADQCTLIEGEVETLPSLADLNGKQGFVIAPFDSTPQTPLLLIKPDKISQDSLHPSCVPSVASDQRSSAPFTTHLFPPPSGGVRGGLLSSPSHTYLKDFATFHEALMAGQFQKLVLARCAIEPNDASNEPLALFHKACKLYPRMFIALVSTPQSGTWLTATPEILLESLPHSDHWRTIALAGTMRLHDDELDGEGLHLRWSTKNIQEQRYVASFIADTLYHLGIDYEEEGPRTVRAANLVHLRSDFTFIYNSTRVGDLLAALHPTPAVSGLPKEKALTFITTHEQAPRRYYSGFMGPLNLPSLPLTHLYVSLRCMQIEEDAYHLYAGGGLLRDSSCDKEWCETEAKMETMRKLLNGQIVK